MIPLRPVEGHKFTTYTITKGSIVCTTSDFSSKIEEETPIIPIKPDVPPFWQAPPPPLFEEVQPSKDFLKGFDMVDLINTCRCSRICPVDGKEDGVWLVKDTFTASTSTPNNKMPMIHFTKNDEVRIKISRRRRIANPCLLKKLSKVTDLSLLNECLQTKFPDYPFAKQSPLVGFICGRTFTKVGLRVRHPRQSPTKEIHNHETRMENYCLSVEHGDTYYLREDLDVVIYFTSYTRKYLQSRFDKPEVLGIEIGFIFQEYRVAPRGNMEWCMVYCDNTSVRWLTGSHLYVTDRLGNNKTFRTPIEHEDDRTILLRKQGDPYMGPSTFIRTFRDIIYKNRRRFV